MLRKLICLMLCLALVALTACTPTIPPVKGPWTTALTSAPCTSNSIFVIFIPPSFFENSFSAPICKRQTRCTEPCNGQNLFLKSYSSYATLDLNIR